MIVCHCNVVSDRAIAAAIADGARDECALAAACGAGANCGGCLPRVRQMLTDDADAPMPDAMVRTVRERLGLTPHPAPAAV